MSVLFYIFSAVMLVFGLMVVLNRNPVSSALSLVVSFLGLAALFITLNAYFIGVIQVLVYTGAVMVLFIFIIMLLDIKKEQRRDLNYVAMGGGIIVVLALISQLAILLGDFVPGNQQLATLPEDSAVHQDVKLVGEAVFTDFNFHLQLLGILLLVATVGVVVLSRRQGRADRSQQ
ncbi:MAG: NADH-quinone oxidoreductase subunit J [Verrucomicrobiales bacterium]|nr:NADH-quinone oxidoreductase subunit J [Verrucomicrobiales bacterium]